MEGGRGRSPWKEKERGSEEYLYNVPMQCVVHHNPRAKRREEEKGSSRACSRPREGSENRERPSCAHPHGHTHTVWAGKNFLSSSSSSLSEREIVRGFGVVASSRRAAGSNTQASLLLSFHAPLADFDDVNTHIFVAAAAVVRLSPGENPERIEQQLNGHHLLYAHEEEGGGHIHESFAGFQKASKNRRQRPLPPSLSLL